MLSPDSGPAVQARVLRYLALGDSYTIGEGVDPRDRWPRQLAARVRRHKIPLGDPFVIAKTGWTTDELTTGMDAARPEGPFDLVSLLIGVNDQYRDRSVEKYRPELRSLIARCVALTAGRPWRVIVVSIPDWGVTPFAATRNRATIAMAIDRFNAVNREEAAAVGATYLDITPTSRTAAHNRALIASDGLHPSGAMYDAWARLAEARAIAALAHGR